MVIMIYPLLNILAISLSSTDFINAGQITWYPKGFNIRGYQVIFNASSFFTAYKNSILYAAVGTFITLMLCSLLAYPLSMPNLVHRKFISIFLAITMFFYGGLIPTYLVIKGLGMINTFLVMVLPASVPAYYVFVFRTFFQGLPVELRESAFMDGANDFIILFRIILPLSKPLLSTFALFSIVAHWNRWFEALIYLKDSKRFPVQLLLRRILIDASDLFSSLGRQNLLVYDWTKVSPKNIQMASVFVVMFPILLVYPFIQRYFIKGALVGAIKA